MKDEAKKTKVAGVDRELLNEAAIDEALAKLDIVAADGMSVEGKAEVLRMQFDEMEPGKLVKCDVPGCESFSLETLDRCPFCGNGDDDAPTDEDVAEEQDMETNDEILAEEAEQEGTEIEGTEEEMEGTPGTAIQLDPQNLPPVEQVPQAPLKKLDRVTAEEIREKKRGPGRPKKMLESPMIELAEKAIEVKAELVRSVRDLDEAVAEIKAMATKWAGSTWEMAERVALLDEGGLWKLRTTSEGKVAYRTYEEFVRSELAFDPTFVLALKKCYVRFSQEDFQKVGFSKLRFVLRAPEENQEELLQKLRTEGMSTRQVQATSQELREKAGLPPSRPKTEKEKSKESIQDKGKPAPPKADPNKITVAVVVKKVRSGKFWKKPEKKGETPVQAKQASADGAYAKIDLENDICLWIQIKKNDDGTLGYKAEFRRVDE